MHPLLRPWLALFPIAYLLFPAPASAAPFSTNANRLAYLDEDNPFYPHRDFPRLTTPQWIGEPGVEAAVILAIDDMRDSKKYETYLRPILDRLKKLDGRAPVSVFANVVTTNDTEQLQTWLAEGLSLEVHTLTHPCPLLQKGSFTNAWNTYHGGVDLLSKVPGNKPVAFRMPCCDSMNSPSPRFYAEIFNRTSPDGNFLQADSSVMCLLTDHFLKRHGVKPPPHSPSPIPHHLPAPDHFRRYFPAQTNALTKKFLANFGTYIEDYPYPYVINRTCWEFPAMVPSDWEAFNAHGPTNAATVADWQLALDTVVRAQGVFTFIFHPHGWIRSDQIIQFIDHAERTHGKKVKFLTFKEAVERLETNLLDGTELRWSPEGFHRKRGTENAKQRTPIRASKSGFDAGIRLLDLNNDGFMDVVIAGAEPFTRKSRIWDSANASWRETGFPTQLIGQISVHEDKDALNSVFHSWHYWTKGDVRLGNLAVSDGLALFNLGAGGYPYAWQFGDGTWGNNTNILKGAPYPGSAFVGYEGTSEDRIRRPIMRSDLGVRFRDFDRDGRCELLVSNDKQNAIFAWSDTERTWKKLPYALPPGLALVNERGEDNGLRFVDLNGDGFDDLIFSNEKEYAIYLWAREVKPNLGWHAGWSHKVLHEQRPKVGQASSLSSNSNSPAPAVGTPIPHSPSPIPSPKEIPPFVRSGPHRNNGAWFHRGQLFVQNEDTAHLPDVVWRKSFSELIAFDMPAPKSPAESQQCFQARPGFRVELVAAEPLVQSPVAFEWGADGKLWVVEMGDYPNGIPEHEAHPSPALRAPSPLVGRGERAGVRGGGKVKLLEDLDGDGRYDKATIFLDHLPFPTGVMPWRKGVLISAAPDILYAEDTDGDGRADVRKVLFTGFREGNQQHRVNGFELGLDNWIYGANGDSGGIITFVSTVPGAPPHSPSPIPHSPVSISGRDFRFRPDTGEFEAIEGQTQFGRRRDDWGNWFGNNNPIWLWHYWLPDRYLRRNPHLAVKSSRQMLANYPDSTRCYPISTPPIRFNQPQSVNHVTSGCSPAPYRDDLFGPGFATSVFISEPVHNLVHREALVPDGVSFTSRRAPDEQDREFLASTDNWFRPTMLKTGPDGALYIADFYRFVLEHPEWIAPETQARLDLRAGADKGRIWRVVPEGKTRRKTPNLAELSHEELVTAMNTPNGWQRDTVQRLIVEGQLVLSYDFDALLTSPSSQVRLQALATREALDSLSPDDLFRSLRDDFPVIRQHALSMAATQCRKLDEGKLTHTIRSGDSLGSISRTYGSTVVRVRELNGLTSDLIRVGAKLKIEIGPPSELALPSRRPMIHDLPEAMFKLAEDPDKRVRTQLAFSLGEQPSKRAGEVLARLALREFGDQHMQTAILSSIVPHAKTMLPILLAAPEVEPPAGLVEQLLGVATMSGQDKSLVEAIDYLVKPKGGKFSNAQLTALASFLDALEKRGTPLAKFAPGADTELGISIRKLDALFMHARAVASRQPAITDLPSLIAATRLLGRGPSGRTEDLATLATLLKPQQPAEIQTAAVAQLAKLGGSDSASALLADWKAHSPALREAVLSALLSRPAWIDTLLAALERGQVAPTQISPAQRQKLTTHPQAALRDRATKLFAATSADRAKVIKDYAVVATLTGSETRGRELFTKQCGVCHKLKGEGREIGPDLAMTAARDTDWLLTAILDPNAAVESRYLGYTAETKSGREFTGIITAETPNNLVMRGVDGTEETILRTDLKQLLSSGLSMMPEGMESALKPQDMADLLAFIRAK